MTLKDQIATGFVWLIVAALCWLVGTIIYFGITSKRSVRGWKKRLRHPRIPEVEFKWRVKLPPILESFFQSGIAERCEFYLAPPGTDRESDWWYVASFIPLTCQDVGDWIKLAKVPGIPLGEDGAKGVYYLPFDQLRDGRVPTVLLQPPGRKPKAVTVASSVEQFIAFEPRNPKPD